MKNLLNPDVRKKILERVTSLVTDDKAQWGKMNVHQMVVHCTDQLRMASGETGTAFVGNPLSTTLLKYLILTVVPAPKGKIETVPELKQGACGTKPEEFNADKEKLLKMISETETILRSDIKVKHPFFGAMSKNEWGRLCWLHLDHHLRQFGK